MTVLKKVYLWADKGLEQRAKEAAAALGMKMPDFYRMSIEFGVNAANLVENERKLEQAQELKAKNENRVLGV